PLTLPNPAPMDVESVLLSVQERDKWRRRLDVLQAALFEARQKRVKLLHRVRRLRRELAKLSDYSETVLRNAARFPISVTVHATHDSHTAPR
ncbi:MAG: hypothetical protein WA761_04490, partial [Thermoplasmata archaeon]